MPLPLPTKRVDKTTQNPYWASCSWDFSASGGLRVSRTLTPSEIQALDDAVQETIDESDSSPDQFRTLALAYCRKAAAVLFQNHRPYWKLDLAAILDPFLQNLDDSLDADGECYMAATRYANRIFAPEGFDPIDVAQAKADSTEVFALASLRLPKLAEKIAKFAYFMAEAIDAPFTLPQRRLAEWLQKHQTSVSNAIYFLQSKGVIKCVDPYFCHKEHRAKQYRFSLPHPQSP